MIDLPCPFCSKNFTRLGAFDRHIYKKCRKLKRYMKTKQYAEFLKSTHEIEIKIREIFEEKPQLKILTKEEISKMDCPFPPEEGY